jgi:hypothetical protein
MSTPEQNIAALEADMAAEFAAERKAATGDKVVDLERIKV